MPSRFSPWIKNRQVFVETCRFFGVSVGELPFPHSGPLAKHRAYRRSREPRSQPYPTDTKNTPKRGCLVCPSGNCRFRIADPRQSIAPIGARANRGTNPIQRTQKTPPKGGVWCVRRGSNPNRRRRRPLWYPIPPRAHNYYILLFFTPLLQAFLHAI